MSSPSHPSSPPPDSRAASRILIIKRGALGDVVRTSYHLPGLRARFPNGVEVTWLTAANAVDLLRFNPGVDRILTFEALRAGVFERELRAERFDWVVSLDDEPDCARWAGEFPGAKVSGAHLADGGVHYTDDTAPWFEMGLISRLGKTKADELKRVNQESHASIFARMLGVGSASPSFFGNTLAESLMAARMRGAGRRVGLILNAGTRWPSKSLRKEEALKLVGLLSRAGWEPWLLGGADDHGSNAELARASGGLAPRFPPPEPLLSFAARIKQCDLVVCADTLGMHLAIAQRVPVVVFFAPTSAAEIDLFGNGVKVCSTAPDYCSYKPDADNSTVTAERIVEGVGQLASSLGRAAGGGGSA
jgi:heptosyltransferase-2